MKNKRRNHSAQFKAKVALIAEIIASTVKPTTKSRPRYNRDLCRLPNTELKFTRGFTALSLQHSQTDHRKQAPV
jgi:hypothetical protein